MIFRPGDLPRRVPFFYGWVIVACAVCAAFARQGAAVATLSVFVEPMTSEFGWSRAALSGAVSLGGVLAALAAPLLGPLVDRRGARAVLTIGALVVGVAAAMLAHVSTLAGFYLWFSLGRLTFASSFDIGISSAIANWFVRRRAQAMSFVTLGSTLGLAIMPLLAYAAIAPWGWRAGWLVVAGVVVLCGVLPNAAAMIRRPEDVGLRPDGDRADGSTGAAAEAPERQLSRGQALRTRSAWLLMLYSALIFPVQAGISLHQAPHIIQVGLSPTVAATVVSTYSVLAAMAGLGYGLLARWLPVRYLLALSAAMMALSAVTMLDIASALQAYLSAALFGAGIGGLLTLLPVAWADYFGRRHLGSIRGVTLPVQVVAQAAGPLLAGLLYDRTGSYDTSLAVLGGCAAAAAVVALLALPPPNPAPDPLPNLPPDSGAVQSDRGG